MKNYLICIYVIIIYLPAITSIHMVTMLLPVHLNQLQLFKMGFGMSHHNVHNTPLFHPKQLVTPTTTYDHNQGRTNPTNNFSTSITHNPQIKLYQYHKHANLQSLNKTGFCNKPPCRFTYICNCATNLGALDAAASLKPTLHSFLKPS